MVALFSHLHEVKNTFSPQFSLAGILPFCGGDCPFVVQQKLKVSLVTLQNNKSKGQIIFFFHQKHFLY
jgi:hypothetical protein